MQMLFPIGQNSNNQLEWQLLNQMPHLFVAYSTPTQLKNWLQQLLKKTENTACYLLLNTKLATEIAENLQAIATRYTHIIHAENPGDFPTRKAFFTQLLKEMKKRLMKIQRYQLKLKANPNLKISAPTFAPLFIFIEDTIQLLGPSKSNLGIALLKILLAGQQVNMHCVCASCFSYHTLIKQLSHLHIPANKMLYNFTKDFELTAIPPLGAEIIFSAENLIFFKKKDEANYQTRFWIQ